MPSLQSHLVKAWLKRQQWFGGERVDPHFLRARLDRAAGRFRHHRRVQVVAVQAGPVPAEWLIPPVAPADRALLYIHGGAWFMGSSRTHRGLVSHLAYLSGVRALSIDYRLAPEHPFPAGLEDCLAAYEWLLQSGMAPDKVVVAGDSAGGNLALALLIALRDAGRPLPAAAVVLSPATDLAGTGESYRTRRHLDPLFSQMGAHTIVPAYITDHDPRHPLISPLHADLHGLPPLLIHVGDHEMLLDDAVRFGERAVAAGVEATTVVWPGMFHVFQLFVFLPEARRANAQIAAFIRARLGERRKPMSATILVAYATRYGSTREVAEAIGATLREGGLEVTIVPLREVRSLAGYDAIVIGAPLYMFRWHRDALRFLSRHRQALSALPVAVFALGPTEDKEEDWQRARSDLDRALAQFPWLGPAAVAVFGGRFDPAALRFPLSLVPGIRQLPAGDLRDWTAIRDWAASLPTALRMRT